MEGLVLRSFEFQAIACADLGSPFTATLCRLLAERLDASSRFGARILGWPGKPFPDALPLRTAGALHALKRSGRSPGLVAAYPPAQPTDAELWDAIASAVAAYDEVLCGWLDGPPQTNEVARSAFVLGGCLQIAAETGLPIELYEIGASAGLNLGFDRYRYEFGEGLHWGDPAAPVVLRCRFEGDAPPLSAPLAVAARAGCDRSPLDPGSPADRERLLAYVWPDQTERLARTEAALAAAVAAPWRVERADAGAWLADRLSEPAPSGRVRTVMHSIVWQYLAEPTKAALAGALQSAAARATPEAPLAWLRMESETREKAGIRLTLWPGGTERRLGDADYHGRWIRWHPTI